MEESVFDSFSDNEVQMVYLKGSKHIWRKWYGRVKCLKGQSGQCFMRRCAKLTKQRKRIATNKSKLNWQEAEQHLFYKSISLGTETASPIFLIPKHHPWSITYLPMTQHHSRQWTSSTRIMSGKIWISVWIEWRKWSNRTCIWSFSSKKWNGSHRL